MFPTFISILDIQSWWEVPSIAYFCSLFRTSFNLLDFDIEDLEEALLQDGTEDPSWLQELIVRLLIGCLDNNNDISTFNYQMYLRRLFRQKCHESGQPNPFNTDIDFQFLPLRTKVQILHALCDYRLDANDVLDRLKNLEADSLRVEPLGTDQNESRYWYFYGTRLYREDHPIGALTSSPGKKPKTVWQVICFTEDDWHNLAKKFKNSQGKSERRLYKVLKENFLPDLPRLFHEKEVLHRKRLLEWLPMRRGASLRRGGASLPPATTAPQNNSPPQNKKLAKKHKTQSITDNEKSDNDDENSESKNQKNVSSPAPKKRKSRELRALTDGQNQTNDSVIKPISCGRQTNNSLASATGDRILIKQSTPPPPQPNNKKVQEKNVKEKEKEKPGKEEEFVKKRGRKKKDTNVSVNAGKEINPSSKEKDKVQEKILSEVLSTTADLDDLRIGMYKVLESVKAHEDAWPFIEPVEEEYAPNYYTVVRKPMDLQTMEDRLDAGAYTSSERFKNDFKLIVDNCTLYNGAENEYTEMVANLTTAFKIAVKKYLDHSDENSSSSEEDEIVLNDPKIRSNSPIPKVKHKKHKKHNKTQIIQRKRTPSPKERSPTPPPKREPTPPPPPVKRGRGRPAKNKSIAIEKTKVEPPPPPPPKIEAKKPKTIKKESRKRSPSPKERSPTSEKNKNSHKRKIEDEEGDLKKPDFKKIDVKKDKNVKLRETIEKLKEMNNLTEDSIKKKGLKESGSPVKRELPPPTKKENKLKPLIKAQTQGPSKKCEFDFEDDEDYDLDERDKNISKKSSKITNKKVQKTDIDALEAATEQTLKDINKWLDDTPKFSEFSSASNSPLHLDEEPHLIGGISKLAPMTKRDFRVSYRGGKRRLPSLKEGNNTSHNPPGVKRPQQRTIDRLQPGKSKGNLLSNPGPKEPPNEENEPPLFPLGRIREAKGVAVKTLDESNTPKLSLGTVLDSFGKHKFETGDEVVKKSPKSPGLLPGDKDDTPVKEEDKEKVETKVEEVEEKVEAQKEVKKETADVEVEKPKPKSATPNLSAWFKAFGAPKVTPQPSGTTNKKKVEDEPLPPEKEEKEVVKSSPNEEARTRRGGSLEPDSPFGAQIRQRRGSTGSSVSERSSFSQDLDMSPRDERTGVGSYPAPYPSPLHRSPAASASPSPRHDPHTYPAALNGTIRVGFYQDTVTTTGLSKSSPLANNSPRTNSPARNDDIPPPTPNPYGVSSYYQTNNKITHQISINSPPPPTPSIRPPTPDDPEPTISTFPVKKRAYPDAIARSPSPRNSDDEDRHDYSSKDVRIPSLPRRYDDSPPPPTPNPVLPPEKEKVLEKPTFETPLDYVNRPIYGNPLTPMGYNNQKTENMGYDGPPSNKIENLTKPSYENLRPPEKDNNLKINMGYEPPRVAEKDPKVGLGFELNPGRVQEKIPPFVQRDTEKVNLGYEAPKLNPYEVQNRVPLPKGLDDNFALRVPTRGDDKFDATINKQTSLEPKLAHYENQNRVPLAKNLGMDQEKMAPYEGLRVPNAHGEPEKIDSMKLNMGYMSGVNSIDLTGAYPSGGGVVKGPSVTTGVDITQPHHSASQYLASQYADTRLNHPVASYLAAMQNQPGAYTPSPQTKPSFKPSTTENSTFKQSYGQSNTPSPLGHNFDRFSAELHGLAAASYYADKTHMLNKMHMYNQQMAAAAYRTQAQLMQAQGQQDLQQYQHSQPNQQMGQGRVTSPQVSTNVAGAVEQKIVSSSKKSKRSVNQQVPQSQQPVQGFQSYAEIKASSTQSPQEMSQSTSTPQLKGSAFNLPWSEQPGPLLDTAIAAAWAQRSAGAAPSTPGSTSSAYTSLTAPPPPYLNQPTTAPSIDQPLYQQYLQSMGLLTGGAGPPPHPGGPPAPYPHPHHPHHQYHPALAPQLGRQQPFHNMNRPWM